MSSLMERGCYARLRSTPNYQSASAWTSLVTGVNPGKHGIFHFMNPQPGSYELVGINASFRKAPTIWRLLSEAGAQVAALNFPVSYPAEAVRGVQIAGWLAPSAASPGFSYPPELARELLEQFGRYPIQPDVRRHVSAERYEQGVQAALEGIGCKGEVGRWILGQREWDCFGIVFVESDSVQHWYWRLLDPSHPEHDRELAERHGDAILRVYRAVDAEIGRLLEAAGDEANVIVVSDHGQAANPGGQVCLRGWLCEAGLLVARPSGARGAVRRALGAGLELVKRHAPNALKARLAGRFPGLRSRALAGMRGMAADWARTRAWTDAGHIFINLRGRQPQGVVEPGDEHERLLGSITEGLLSLTESASGERPVREVVRRDEVIHGPHAGFMPDLLVHWRNEVQVRGLVWRDARGAAVTIERPAGLQLPSGTHHPDGVLVAVGPDFEEGLKPPPLSIYDVAPTVLHLLGQAVPSYFDGRVATNLLTREAAAEVKVREVALEEETGGTGAPDEDRRVVEERLRALGYIE
jgi:predicted AlkP superfamily phosphohydrolase/phosphomutase